MTNCVLWKKYIKLFQKQVVLSCYMAPTLCCLFTFLCILNNNARLILPNFYEIYDKKILQF